ncbi:hypothetical protein EWM64_g2498 [Hericium alpestre]|uniref:Uncharacterized protein n=1 Tax=Hericium alpestre TaxID=135208 RepID=A0A4Z0A5A7_9AGAM|nr:hypothetical protein EWM64_g2498 [Hericium alpestre]
MASPAKKGAAFFDELLKNSDPEIVKRIKAGVGDDLTTPGNLVAHILDGKLSLHVDNVKGWGETV